MADFRQVTDSVSVSPQIELADIDAALAKGFTLIINNRPDGEVENQPTNAELSVYAEGKGLKWTFIPITPGQMTMEAIEVTSLALGDSEKTLAFCRSGTRSCTLWGLAEAYRAARPVTEIMTLAQQAGYDLSGMAPTLEHLHSNAS